MLLFVACPSWGALAYRPEFYNSDAAAESDRLLAQVQMSFDAEAKVMDLPMSGTRRVLELGCGPGE